MELLRARDIISTRVASAPEMSDFEIQQALLLAVSIMTYHINHSTDYRRRLLPFLPRFTVPFKAP